MTYRIFLIIILFLIASSAVAGEKRYRVEILVLSHLHHEAVPLDAEWLRDFSSSLDFLEARKDEDVDSANDDDDGPGAELLQEAGSELLPDEEQEEDPWADVIAVEVMCDVMREAWRRLRLSAPFRPEQYLSWEQSADEPFPALRIHDLNVLLIENSCTELQETAAFEAQEDELKENEAKENEDGPFVFTDQDNILPGDAIEDSAEELELPDPTLFYRIDGTVMLRRSRFLHLDIDIELRQASFDEQPLTPSPILGGEGESGVPDESEPTLAAPFLIHKLEQSRQVKSQRMEYFDSPVLGVLAWITPFEAEDEAEMLEAFGESD